MFNNVLLASHLIGKLEVFFFESLKTEFWIYKSIRQPCYD